MRLFVVRLEIVRVLGREERSTGRGEGCCPQPPAPGDRLRPRGREPVLETPFPPEFFSALSEHIKENICVVLGRLVCFFLNTLYF